MSFLDQGYELPKKEISNRYLNKFEEGDTRIRILGSAKTGYEYWLDQNGTVREGQIQKGDKPVRIGKKDGLTVSAFENSKHFWAFPIYNYNTASIQIAKVTSFTIQSNINTLIDDEDWGSPLNYDIVIKRTGKGFNDTEYSVVPKPAKGIDPAILKDFKELNIDMDAWMRSEDPFKQVTAPTEDPIALDARKALK